MGAIADSKALMIRRLSEEEDYVLLVIDPRCSGVMLPENLMASAQPVGINIGWRMAVPIPDLKVDAEGIAGTLSFQRTPHFCRFPWAAIMQITVDDEHLVWVIRRTRATVAQARQTSETADQEGKKAPANRSHLRLVD